jgi:hypothetical protein
VVAGGGSGGTGVRPVRSIVDLRTGRVNWCLLRIIGVNNLPYEIRRSPQCGYRDQWRYQCSQHLPVAAHDDPTHHPSIENSKQAI